MDSQVLVSVEAQKAVEETAIMVKSFDNYIVSAPEEYKGANDDLRRIKVKTKQLDDLRKSLTKPLDESKKRIMEFFSKPLEFLEKAESAVKSAMLNWQQEQERIRLEEERKIQEAARKEEERLRKIKEEQERVWREKQEALRKEAERLENEGKSKEAMKALIEAEKAKIKADERAAQAEEISVPVPVLESKVEKMAGLSTRTIWKFRITDSNKIPRQYLIPNEKMLGDVAKTTKGSLQIDGVEFYSEEILSSKI